MCRCGPTSLLGRDGVREVDRLKGVVPVLQIGSLTGQAGPREYTAVENSRQERGGGYVAPRSSAGGLGWESR